MALAYLLKYAQLKMMDGRKDLRQIGDLLEEQLDGSGLESLFERGDVQVISHTTPISRQLLSILSRRMSCIFLSSSHITICTLISPVLHSFV